MNPVVIGLAVLVVVLLYKLRARPIKGIPTTKHSEFYFGVTRHMITEVFLKRNYSMLEYCVEEGVKGADWKGSSWCQLGGLNGISIVEPDDIKFMLKDKFNSFHKSDMYNEIFERVLGKGIFNSNAEAWKEQRTVAAHMFNRRQLRDRMSTIFGANAQVVIQILRKAMETRQPVEMQALMYHYTFDSINSIAFNRHVDSLKGNQVDRDFQEAFDAIQASLLTRFFLPWWKFNRFFQLTATERSFARNIVKVDEYLYNVVNEYYDKDDNIREDKLEGDQTMTGLFLEHARTEGKTYSREFLRDMIINFLIAGRDTTASTLTSCIEFLCQHPQWQQKLHDEAIACFNGNLQEVLTFDDLEGRSPVAEALVMETVRLHPPVPANEKMTIEEVTFPSGMTVPAGTSVGWMPLAVNRNKKYWGDDAEEFKPERWMAEGFAPSDFMYPTFHGGPRLCLGKNMAILEAKTALLSMAAHFKFSIVPGFVPKVKDAVTWQLTNEGLMVEVHPW